MSIDGHGWEHGIGRCMHNMIYTFIYLEQVGVPELVM